MFSPSLLPSPGVSHLLVCGEILTCSSGDMVGSFRFAQAPMVFWLLLFHITNVTGIRKKPKKPEDPLEM